MERPGVWIGDQQIFKPIDQPKIERDPSHETLIASYDRLEKHVGKQVTAHKMQLAGKDARGEDVYKQLDEVVIGKLTKEPSGGYSVKNEAGWTFIDERNFLQRAPSVIE